MCVCVGGEDSAVHKRDSVCMSGRECVVCVCERESTRQRERERESVCVLKEREKQAWSRQKILSGMPKNSVCVRVGLCVQFACERESTCEREEDRGREREREIEGERDRERDWHGAGGRFNEAHSNK